MGAVTTRLFRRFDRQGIELEVEEELRFHLELLGREHLQLGMPPEQAKAETLKRFGNLEQIKNQCVAISRRSHPLMRALKSFLVLVFLAGVLVRVFSTELHLMRVGDMLIAVGVLGYMLLYARGLSPSSFFPKNETSCQSIFNDGSQRPISAYDGRRLTPIERVISDE